MQASPRPPGPMTAATAQRLVDSNQKQSFPLSSHLPAPPPPSPPSQCYAKPAGTNASTPGTQSVPASPAGFRTTAPFRTQACPRIRGLLPGSAASPTSRGHAARSREQKLELGTQTLGLQQAWVGAGGGGGDDGGGGGAHAACTHFPATVCPSSKPHLGLQASRSLVLPPEHQNTLLSRACSRRGSQAQPEPGTPPHLPFPLHRGARAGAARRRGTQAPPR